MTRLRLATAETFRSLRLRNFRLFFLGQGVSMVGTWMQSVALVWLVLDRTGSGVALGITTALQFAPVLVLSPFTGLAADRLDKRRLFLFTQAAAGLQAAAMAVLVLTGTETIPLIYALTFIFGVVTALDQPVRRALVVELVDEPQVPNAVGLNSALMTGSRVVGPAVAGVLIAGAGVGWCFAVNAASYVAVLTAILRMDHLPLRTPVPAARARGQVREGFVYAWRTPEVRLPIALVAVVSTFAFNFPVLLPLLADRTLHGGASAFSLLYSVMSVGSLAGALLVARRRRIEGRWLAWAAVAYGGALTLLAAAPTLPLAVAAAVPVGLAAVLLLSGANSSIQLSAAPAMRGRVNALFAMVFLGSTPLGGPLA
ncbi:MAG: MFS transporter, partial [Actinomycetota bacterium]|nr:MFS transporter [Actinomycetota bacterium]